MGKLDTLQKNVKTVHNLARIKVDMDGFSGFNDPSLGLNTVASNPTSAKNNFRDTEDPPRSVNNARNIQQQRAQAHRFPNNNAQNQNMASTAWFMPFNIEPPTSVDYSTSNNEGETGFEDFGGFDTLMGMDGMQDMQEWIPFTPANREDHQI